MNNQDIIFKKNVIINMRRILISATSCSALATFCNLLSQTAFIRFLLELAVIVLSLFLLKILFHHGHPAETEKCSCCGFMIDKETNYCPYCGTKNVLEKCSVDEFERKQYSKDLYEMAENEQKKSEQQLLEDFTIVSSNQVSIAEKDIQTAWSAKMESDNDLDYLKELED